MSTPPSIYVTVTIEPPDYYSLATDESCLSVHLAFDADDEAAMQTLLNTPGWTFTPYRLGVGGASATPVSAADIAIVQEWSAPQDIDGASISNWLNDRKSFENAPPSDVVSADRANALGTLLGSVGWTAPVPHSAKLMRVIKLKNIGSVAVSDLFLLPANIGNIPALTVTPSSGSQKGRQVAVVVNDGGPYNGFTFIANELFWTFAELGITLPTNVNEALDPNAFPVPVRKDGYLFSVRAEDDFRFLQAFESRAASLFSCLPALLDLDPKLLDAVATQDLGRLAFAAALDPLWLSLLSPGADSREGALLAPLMRICEQQGTSLSAKTVFQKWIRDQLKLLTLADLLDGSAAILKDLFALPTNSDSLNTALQSLRAMSATLQQESGLEQVLDRVMNNLAIKATTAGHLEYSDWIAEYRQLLKGPWNATDAVRHDYGHLLSVWLTDESRAHSPALALYDVAHDADPYTQRLANGAVANSWYNRIKDSVLAVNTGVTDVDAILKKAWEQSVNRALGSTVQKSSTRFVPDRTPQPIPISIAASPSAEKLDEFTAIFNGTAIVLKRDTQDWAHANLISLYPLEYVAGNLRYRTSWDPGKVALKPFLPVSMDGRQEMFVPFYGLPLASPAFAGTGGPGLEPIELDVFKDPLSRPFYKQKDVEFTGTAFQKPPRLGYGYPYLARAIALSKAGVPPKELQNGGAGLPWVLDPAIDFSAVPNPDEVTTRFSCQRRTAIGSNTFGSRPPQRIGADYPDVFPLALDYPRASLLAGKGSVSILDLFRRTDGVGQLLSPAANKNRTFTLIGHQLATTDNNALLTVNLEVYADANVDLEAVPLASLSLDRIGLVPLLGQTWTIEIISNDGTPSPPAPNLLQLKINAVLDPDAYIWVRLRFTTAADGAAWSFGAPEPNTEDNPGAEQGSHPPILLVADDNTRWGRPFTDATRFECVLSRTTWLDWERWFNNSTLAINGKPRTPLISDGAKVFGEASIMRGEDSTGQLSNLLDRLPDPAVSKLLVELAQVDSIPGSTSYWSTGAIVLDARDWLRSQDIPSEADPVEYFNHLCSTLKNIDRRFRIKFSVTGGSWNLSTTQITEDSETYDLVNVTVPPGAVAKLTVKPLVDEQLFDLAGADASKPLCAGLLQLATGKYSVGGAEYMVFPGAELTVEGMFYTAWIPGFDTDYKNTLKYQFEVQCAKESRGYRIVEVTAKQAVDLARSFSHVDVRTQRWRFSGRPIYHWISPRDYRTNNVGNGAQEIAMELDRETHADRVSLFESQLFFERDDLDCQITRIRLLGAGTELANITWESPSATYYRHGFTLISRYAGALRDFEKDSVWPYGPTPWNRCCAILADASRIDVTSPQVRCLVPLSNDTVKLLSDSSEVVMPQYPNMNAAAPSPPLACVLEEKPFAVGGLADRILPEILTGVGYGFESPDGSVQPLDTGKETSRDGRLDGRSWKYDPISYRLDPSHFFALEPEGPIGTHFERATVPAPAWANCQYMLKPRTVSDKKRLPDESFFGVRLQRILEPEWVTRTAAADPDANNLPLFESWQLSMRGWAGPADQNPIDLVSVEDSAGAVTPVAQCILQDTFLVFRFNRQLLGKGYTANNVIVCAVPAEFPLPELRLQHLSRGDGRYILSILANAQDALPNANIERGSSNFPLLLARVEWKTNDDLQLTTDNVHLKFYKPPSAHLDQFDISTLSSSPATVREWGRTAKNADWVHRFDGTQCKPIPIATLEAAKRLSNAGDKLVFSNTDSSSLWLMSSLADSRQPLHIQRHLVAVFTKRSRGDGKLFDLYLGATMINGQLPAIANARPATKLQLHELEIPSAIVAAGVALTEFESAKLDLVATGGVTTSAVARSYRLHVRFANSALGMSSAAAINIVLKALSTNNLETVLGDVPCENQVRAIDIFLQNGLPIKFRYHSSSGVVKDVRTLAPATPVVGLTDAESIAVSLQTSPGFGEVWADVSLLHNLPAADGSLDPDHFDFDWLFSNHEAEPSPASRLSSSALSTLTEAQARFVSASAAIDLSSE